MRFARKINIFKYLLSTAGLTAALCLYFRELHQIYGILISYGFSLLYFAMFLEIRVLIIDQTLDRIQGSISTKLFWLKIGSLAALLIGLYSSWQFMGNQVVISIINYVIHIFILAFCLKK